MREIVDGALCLDDSGAVRLACEWVLEAKQHGIEVGGDSSWGSLGFATVERLPLLAEVEDKGFYAVVEEGRGRLFAEFGAHVS